MGTIGHERVVWGWAGCGRCRADGVDEVAEGRAKSKESKAVRKTGDIAEQLGRCIAACTHLMAAPAAAALARLDDLNDDDDDSQFARYVKSLSSRALDFLCRV